MNAKTAKTIRRMAQVQTIGAPEREYYRDRNGSIRLDRDCVRGRYRVLKRAANRPESLAGVSAPIYILYGPETTGGSIT